MKKFQRWFLQMGENTGKFWISHIFQNFSLARVRIGRFTCAQLRCVCPLCHNNKMEKGGAFIYGRLSCFMRCKLGVFTLRAQSEWGPLSEMKPWTHGLWVSLFLSFFHANLSFLYPWAVYVYVVRKVVSVHYMMCTEFTRRELNSP